MSTPNTPGPGRVSAPVLFLIDEDGYVVGYRNPKTQENVYEWFAGGSGGDTVTYVAPDYVAPGYVA